MNRTHKLKCWTGNLDGSRRGLVFAYNQKEAAAVAMTSIYDFRRFWYVTDYPPEPYMRTLTLYTRPFDLRTQPHSHLSWTEGRCVIKK